MTHYENEPPKPEEDERDEEVTPDESNFEEAKREAGPDEQDNF